MNVEEAKQKIKQIFKDWHRKHQDYETQHKLYFDVLAVLDELKIKEEIQQSEQSNL